MCPSNSVDLFLLLLREIDIFAHYNCNFLENGYLHILPAFAIQNSMCNLCNVQHCPLPPEENEHTSKASFRGQSTTFLTCCTIYTNPEARTRAFIVSYYVFILNCTTEIDIAYTGHSKRWTAKIFNFKLTCQGKLWLKLLLTGTLKM